MMVSHHKAIFICQIIGEETIVQDKCKGTKEIISLIFTSLFLHLSVEFFQQDVKPVDSTKYYLSFISRNLTPGGISFSSLHKNFLYTIPFHCSSN